MNLDKQFLRTTLQDVIKKFSAQIMPIDEPIELRFVEKEKFLESAKNDTYLKLLIDRGVIKNFDSEYPNFLVVYKSDKNPVRQILGLPFYISVCFEIAKDKAKAFTAEEFRSYLAHGFAHEITHVYQDRIKTNNPSLWAEALEKGRGIEDLGHESLAEMISDRFGDSAVSKQVEQRLWAKIYAQARKLGLMK